MTCGQLVDALLNEESSRTEKGTVFYSLRYFGAGCVRVKFARTIEGKGRFNSDIATSLQFINCLKVSPADYASELWARADAAFQSQEKVLV